MRHLLKNFGLLLLLLVAQQGAVVHELSHAVDVTSAEAKVVAQVADTSCALCPAFAQVVTPAFSHSFHLPLLVRAALEPSAKPLYEAADTPSPTPRSRGPPTRT